MRPEKTWAVLIAGLALAAHSCAVHFYPRPVTEKEKFQVNLAYQVDTFAARAAQDLIFKASAKAGHQKIVVENYLFYADPKFKIAANFYGDPGALKGLKIEKLKSDSEYEIFLLSWPSLYQPLNPEFNRLYQAYPETQTAYAVYYRHKTPCRAALVRIHGFMGGPITKESLQRKYKMRELANQGFDVILLQQPYHGLRAPAGSLYSGELFLSGELSRINEAMRQAVTDLRTLVKWLKQDHQLVGIYGTSLGGMVALATTTAEPNLDFTIALIPSSDWTTLFANSPLVSFVAQGAWNSGVGLLTAKAVLYPTCPDNFPPAIPKDDILIIAGIGDNIVPPREPLQVWEKWDKPNIYWYPGGHALVFNRKGIVETQNQFLARQLKKLDLTD